MLTPIIFLDFDGVINTPFIIDKHPTVYNHKDNSVSNTQSIKLLNWIYLQYPFNIVISSTWRLGLSKDELHTILLNSGLNPAIKILGTTPDLRRIKYDHFFKIPFTNKYFSIHTRRGHEIDQWIHQNDFKGQFFILDDDSDMWKYKKHLIQLNPHDGLTMSKACILRHKLQQVYEKEEHKCQK